MVGKPFNQAAPIIHTFNNNGYECFFVGGSVRDYQLKRPIGDIDLATNADHTPFNVYLIEPYLLASIMERYWFYWVMNPMK